MGDQSKVTKNLPEEPGLEHAELDACAFLPLQCMASAKGGSQHKSNSKRRKLVMYTITAPPAPGLDRRALFEGNGLGGFISSLNLEELSHSVMDFSYTLF